MDLISTQIKESNQKFSSQYRGQLANHLPMALFALYKLGADESTLKRYYHNYIKRLEPANRSRSTQITKDSWTEHLGKDRYHQEYLDFFTTEIDELGREGCLKAYLPYLFSGVSGGAFHGLIRVGYALDSDNDEEIIHGLGYWAVSFQRLDLQLPSRSNGSDSFPEVITALHQNFDGSTFKAPNIAIRMSLVSQIDGFQEILSGLDVNSITLGGLSLIMAEGLRATKNFTVLHGVTACHAARLTLPHHPDPQNGLLHLARALAAAYVTIGAPKIESTPAPAPAIDWQKIKAVAIKSTDDHIPKISYSCLEDYAHYKDPVYFLAAESYVAFEKA